MPWGRSLPSPAKTAGTLHADFQETVDAYLDALDTHAADTAERHDAVVTRLAQLEVESASLQQLRDKISVARAA